MNNTPRKSTATVTAEARAAARRARATVKSFAAIRRRDIAEAAARRKARGAEARAAAEAAATPVITEAEAAEAWDAVASIAKLPPALVDAARALVAAVGNDAGVNVAARAFGAEREAAGMPATGNGLAEARAVIAAADYNAACRRIDAERAAEAAKPEAAKPAAPEAAPALRHSEAELAAAFSAATERVFADMARNCERIEAERLKREAAAARAAEARREADKDHAAACAADDTAAKARAAARFAAATNAATAALSGDFAAFENFMTRATHPAADTVRAAEAAEVKAGKRVDRAAAAVVRAYADRSREDQFDPAAARRRHESAIAARREAEAAWIAAVRAVNAARNA